MPLDSCSVCPALVPAGASHCPNCDAPQDSAPAKSRASTRTLGIAGALRWTGSAAVALTLMACYGAPPFNDPCDDGDGDGYYPACYDDVCDPADPYCDCNDADPRVHPDADDPGGDGVDQNCDGVDGVKPK